MDGDDSFLTKPWECAAGDELHSANWEENLSPAPGRLPGPGFRGLPAQDLFRFPDLRRR